MMAKVWRMIFCCGFAMVLRTETHAVDLHLARFAAVKEKQIRESAETLTNKVPAIVWSFFDAVRVDDWETATNLAERIQQASGRYTNSVENEVITPVLNTLIWPSINEMIGTYEQYHEWDNKWLHRFGNDIIDSIPEGSIYFGGTDPGRFIISSLIEPRKDGKRFYVLTQNQLADRTYLDYLAKRYGKKIYIPGSEDSQQAFNEYIADAQRRLQHDTRFPNEPRQIKPGEDVKIVENRVQVRGQVAVMSINGLLTKIIFDKNPTNDFYVEESFPLDWMYPYLSPHGLIFRLHDKPLSELSSADVEKDQAYWRRLTGELIGNWLTNDTPIKEICDFSDKVFLDKKLDGFKGDAGYVKSKDVQKTFSKLRSSVAGLYAWRAKHAVDADEKMQLRNTADLAFRQAFAICPYSPEAIYNYTMFPVKCKRADDAFLLVKTSLRLDPDNSQLRDLIKWIRAAQ